MSEGQRPIIQGEIIDADSFDAFQGSNNPAGINPVALENVLKNLNLSQAQARNVRSLLVGGGTGAVHNYLSRAIGDVPAAIIGAALSAWLAGKVIKGQG